MKPTQAIKIYLRFTNAKVSLHQGNYDLNNNDKGIKPCLQIKLGFKICKTCLTF